MSDEQMPPKRRKGFAAMDTALQREIASRGGAAAHAIGKAHKFSPEEARRAGQIGRQNRLSKRHVAPGLWAARSGHPAGNPRGAVLTKSIKDSPGLIVIPEGSCLLENEGENIRIVWQNGSVVLTAAITKDEYKRYRDDGTVVE